MTIWRNALAAVVAALVGGSASAAWVPDDNGNLSWWDPPGSSVTMDPFATRTPPAAPRLETQSASSGAAELLFLMDTSGSMYDEFAVLCSKINDIIAELQATGLEVSYRILGIAATYQCATETVAGVVGPNTVNSEEDWGPAVEEVSRQGNYPWQSGYVRVAIPMSDEGAENGDSWNTDDDAAIDRAIEQCEQNGVAVLPIIGTPASTSQEPFMLAGAERLASACYGTVQRSIDPAATLANAILAALGDVFNPIDDVALQLYVDDAWGLDTVNKMPGDIAHIVVQATNASQDPLLAKLEVDFPSGWEVVEVIARQNAWAPDASETDVPYTTSDGQVIIENAQIPKVLQSQLPGRSLQYVIKLIIPTDQPSSLSATVTARMSTMPGETAFRARTENFRVTIWGEDQIDTMILTNRALLAKHYQLAQDPNRDVLNTLYRIADAKDARVLYVDWWDLLDDFSGNGNCDGAFAVAVWSRNGADFTSEDSANTVPVCIDNYTHYWAEQLQGSDWQDADTYLLIIGDDIVVPFYRFKASSNALDYATDDWAYGPNAPLIAAAQSGYLLSDIRYSDTDGKDWENGDTDNMYVGRVMTGGDISTMSAVLESLRSEASGIDLEGGATVISSGTGNGESAFKGAAETVGSRLKDVGYEMIDSYSNGASLLEASNRRILDAVADELRNNLSELEHWVYRGHGNNQNFVAEMPRDMSFLGEQPLLTMVSCLQGLADWDPASQPGGPLNHFVYEYFDRGANAIVAATSITDRGYNNDLVDDFIRGVTGANEGDFAYDAAPLSIGESLNQAKTRNKNQFFNSSGSQVSYTLYGAPWKVFTPPDARASNSRPALDFQVVPRLATAGAPTASAQATLRRQYDIASFELEREGGFDFVRIPDYKDLTRGVLTTPVVPVAEVEVALPPDSMVTDIRVLREDSLALGALNIPVFHDAPDLKGVPLPAEYHNAPDSVGLFDLPFESNQFELNGNLMVSVDVYPLVYDAVTNEAMLYQRWTLEVDYTTAAEGVFLSGRPERKTYNLGESIEVPVVLENVTGLPATFAVSAELVESSPGGVVVDSVLEQVPALQAGPTRSLLSLKPVHAGKHRVNVRVTDVLANEIGQSSDFVRVRAGAITAFNIETPVKPGELATFSVEFSNFSTGALEVKYGLTLQDGTTQFAQFVPVVYQVGAAGSQAASFSWEVPAELETGSFSAVANVSAGNDRYQQIAAFQIGNLNCDVDENDRFDWRDTAGFARECARAAEGVPLRCDLNEDGRFNWQDIKEYREMCGSEAR